MIPDFVTNTLYLADTLPKEYLGFYSQFETVLKECAIDFALLTPTKDIWAVDYMPIQITKDKFIQFLYEPNYLTKYNDWIKTTTNVDSICKSISLSTQKSTIKVDGGNIVKTHDKVIMCDRVFDENPTFNSKDLIKQLENLLEVDKIIFIPTDSFDEFGHADGIIRFYDDKTVLINRFSGNSKWKEEKEFNIRLRLSLHNAGLDYIEIPCNTETNKKDIDAKGIYINYLEMKEAIIIPSYGMDEDEEVYKKFTELYKDKVIKTVASNDIAKEGGVLNCISWNILKD